MLVTDTVFDEARVELWSLTKSGSLRLRAMSPEGWLTILEWHRLYQSDYGI